MAFKSVFNFSAIKKLLASSLLFFYIPTSSFSNEWPNNPTSNLSEFKFCFNLLNPNCFKVSETKLYLILLIITYILLFLKSEFFKLEF